jgi:DNA-binding MarR family transcriptional regulator
MTDSDFSPDNFRLLAEFRFRIRQFLHFSEAAARNLGIEPQQHQLMLAIKGLPTDTRPTVRAISSRMCLRHNSTVELINRLAARGALVRKGSTEDRREVLVELTPLGEDLLRQLSELHLQELQSAGPTLAESLQAVLNGSATSLSDQGKLLDCENGLTAVQAQAAEAQA